MRLRGRRVGRHPQLQHRRLSGRSATSDAACCCTDEPSSALPTRGSERHFCSQVSLRYLLTCCPGREPENCRKNLSGRAVTAYDHVAELNSGIASPRCGTWQHPGTFSAHAYVFSESTWLTHRSRRRYSVAFGIVFVHPGHLRCDDNPDRREAATPNGSPEGGETAIVSRVASWR